MRLDADTGEQDARPSSGFDIILSNSDGGCMKKNLILTGWYYPEYLAAAAAVYGHYKGEADVLGV